MTTADPRAQVRDMIADTLSGRLDLQRWAVEGWPTIADDLADEVMGLFREVWQHYTVAGPCYVLRTAPTKEHTLESPKSPVRTETYVNPHIIVWLDA